MVNKKVDIYGYGAVLLELTTSKVAIDGGVDFCLAECVWRRHQKGAMLNDVGNEHGLYARHPVSLHPRRDLHHRRGPSMKEVLHHPAELCVMIRSACAIPRTRT